MAQPQLLHPNTAPSSTPPTPPQREVDFGMLQFRFEVLGEALPTLARENQLNLTILEAYAAAQGWEILKVTNQEQEVRLSSVVAAANLRLSALKAFREIEKFQQMAALEDAALSAATRKLREPELSPGQISSLAQVLKTIRYGQPTPTDEPQQKTMRAQIDVRTD